MLYIPYPFKRCTKCGNDYLPTSKYFSPSPRHKDGFKCWCKPCMSAQTRAYYRDHVDERSEYNRQWNEANPERRRELKRIFYANHRESNLQKGREWRKNNPEKLRLSRKRYYATNQKRIQMYTSAYSRAHAMDAIERSRQWALDNPDKARAHNRHKSRRRRAAKIGLPNAYTHQDWQQAIEYFDHRCAYCGSQQGLWNPITADHFIAIADPRCIGTVPTNMVPACKSCNSSKHKRDPREWLIAKFGKRKAAIILKRILEYFEWVMTAK